MSGNKAASIILNNSKINFIIYVVYGTFQYLKHTLYMPQCGNKAHSVLTNLTHITGAC